ncbi:MAG: protein kinase domain-containing protein [Thermoguttaceae bacterium]
MDVFVSWRDITYEAVRNAGTGGIGKVSFALATNGPNKGVLFAVKVFSPDSPEKDPWKQAFMREVHVLRDCNHPAIVRIFDEGVLGDGRPFFVMECLPDTLSEAMKAGSLDETAKVSIVMQLLSALDYLSRRDPYVVHRDIKPKNIFLKAGTCVLGDFGLIFQDAAAAATGQPEGAIPAMAQKYRTPELVEYHVTGKKPPPASDVFQLGLVAAKLFTGKNPLRPGGPKKPVQLEALADLPGPIGETIKARLQEMIVIETEARLPAHLLLPRWLDLYRTVSRRQALGQRDPVVRTSAVSSGGESAPQNPAQGPPH